jgi:hypothetical protein
MTDCVQERGPTAFAEHAGDAFEVSPNPEQPHDERRVGDQVTGSDDAAHGVFSETRTLKHISGHCTFGYLPMFWASCVAKLQERRSNLNDLEASVSGRATYGSQ